MDPLVIIGSGGYAQEVLWILDDLNSQSPQWDFLGFVDPGGLHRRGDYLYDRPVLGGFEVASQMPKRLRFACGIGAPSIRKKECLHAEELGWEAASLVHPTVVIARCVGVGPGCVVGAGAILAPYAKMGRHCAVNLHVSVGHNAWLGDFAVLCPGARVSGGAILEEGVFMGTNATVNVGKRMGAYSRLGANSFLAADLEPGLGAVGIPARPFTPRASS